LLQTFPNRPPTMTRMSNGIAPKWQLSVVADELKIFEGF
jgi:hypothetical protein